MSTMIIIKNEFAISTFEEENRVVRSTFKGRVKLTIAKEHLDELGAFYLVNKVNASIVDITKVYGSFVKLLDYLKTEFLPKTKLSGLKLKAYVVSDDLMVNHLSSKLVEGDQHNSIYSKVFSNLKLAEEWVENSLEVLKT